MIAYAMSIVLSVTSGVLLTIVKNLMDENKKLKLEREEKEQAVQDGMEIPV